jgi:hypothetical protein
MNAHARIGDLSWRPAIAALVSLLDKPLTAREIKLRARGQYGWTEAFTLNVMAAGEGRSFFTMGPIWHRVATAERGDWSERRVLKGSAARPGRPKNKRECQHCHKLYMPNAGCQRFCSIGCRDAAKRPGWIKGRIGESAA